MANCQNQMRYGQQNMNRQQRPMRNGYGMQQRPDTNCVRVEATVCATNQQEQRGCMAAEPTRGCERQERECGCERQERECGCERQERECGCERQERECGYERQERECGCERQERECGCERQEERDCGRQRKDRLSGMPLAMAYVPWQEWGDLYCAHKALEVGTVFEELDMPFLGRGGCNR